MKKFLGLFNLALVMLVFALGSHARAEEAHNLPRIYVKNLSIDKSEARPGDTIVGEFDLINYGDTAVASVGYLVATVGDYEGGIANEWYDSQVIEYLSLKPGESKRILFHYKVPNIAVGGNVGIQVRAVMSEGLSLGWDDANLRLLGNKSSLSVDKAVVSVADKEYEPNAGPTVYREGDKPRLTITLRNSGADNLKLKHAIVFEKLGDDQFVQNIDLESIMIRENASIIKSVDLPVFAQAGTYLGLYAVYDGDTLVNRINFRYIIAGEIGLIESVEGRMVSTNSKNNLILTVTASGRPYDITGRESSSAQNATIEATVYDDSGKVLGKESESINFDSGSVAEVIINLKSLSQDYRVEVTMKGESGVILDEKTTNLSFDKYSREPILKSKWPYLIIIGFSILLIATAIYLGRRKGRVGLSIMLLCPVIGGGAILGTIYFSDDVKAFVITTITKKKTEGDRARITDIFINTPSGNVGAGEQFFITGSLTAPGCKNDPQTLTVDAVLEGKTGRYSKTINETPGHDWEPRYFDFSISYNNTGQKFSAPVVPGTYRTDFTMKNLVDPRSGEYYQVQGYEEFNAQVVNLCGSASDTVPVYPAPASNLCSTGSASTVSTSTTQNPDTEDPEGTYYTWSCTAGSTYHCSAPIDQTPRCGSATANTYTPGKQVGDIITGACYVPYSPTSAAVSSIVPLDNATGAGQINWSCISNSQSAACSATQSACNGANTYCPTDNRCYPPGSSDNPCSIQDAPSIILRVSPLINYNSSCTINWTLANNPNSNTLCRIYNIDKPTTESLSEFNPSGITGSYSFTNIKTDSRYQMECGQTNQPNSTTTASGICRVNFSSGEFN